MAPAAWNCVLGYPIYSDVNPAFAVVPALSGGAWSAGLPLTNLQNRELSKVARSSNALAPSTQFTADLGVARAWRAYALLGHNCSLAATVRVRAGDHPTDFTGGHLLYDSTTVDVWRAVYPGGSIPSYHPSFATGKLTAESAVGFPMPIMFVPPAPISARYLLTEITDTTNPAGYVQAGRLVIAYGYQPSLNMSYGLRLGYESATQRLESDGGQFLFNAKPRRRSVTFAINDLPQDEALVEPFDLQRRVGTSEQLLFVFDPTDTALMPWRSFLSVFKELSALEMATFARFGVPLSLIEEL